MRILGTKVDPGWAEGELLVPVQNFSRETIRLKYQEKFCTIVFFQNESPPLAPYTSGSSRAKLFRLLAQISTDSFWREVLVTALPVLVIVVFAVAGYFLFGNNTGFAALVACGAAVSSITSTILQRIVRR